MSSVVHIETDEFGQVEIADETGLHLGPGELHKAFGQVMGNAPLMAQLTRWTRSVQRQARRGGLLDRDRYVQPGTTFDQVRTARAARDDDVVDGVGDLTEALAFRKTGFYADDEDEEDAWNQWAGTVDLDGLLRSAWYSYYTDSHVVFTVWWGHETYKVSGVTKGGNERRKTFDLVVPEAISTIDTLKVTPVGDLMFGRERLAYIATMAEAEMFDAILGQRDRLAKRILPSGAPAPRRLPVRWDDEPSLDDDVVSRLLVGRYEPNADEYRLLQAEGVDPQYLYLMQSDSTFRHTATKGGHDRFARVRMKSAFELLDMKNLHRQKDRVFLVGGINFILIVTQGSDAEPASDAEITHLRANVQTIAQMPIIVGDHTLKVDIVVPDQTAVLDRDKWDVTDDRLVSRLLRQFGPRRGGEGDETDTAQLVGQWLENERHMLRRTLEKSVFDVIRKRNEQLTKRPKLRFYPKRIALAFDDAYASFILDMQTSRSISRDTLHSEFGLSQAEEAAMLKREKEQYDDIFGQLAVPGAAPAAGTPAATGPAAQKKAGRQQGGRSNGGGAAPGTGQGQKPRNPRKLSASDDRKVLLDEAKRLEIPGRSRMNRSELAQAINAELTEGDEVETDDDE